MITYGTITIRYGTFKGEDQEQIKLHVQLRQLLRQLCRQLLRQGGYFLGIHLRLFRAQQHVLRFEQIVHQLLLREIRRRADVVDEEPFDHALVQIIVEYLRHAEHLAHFSDDLILQFKLGRLIHREYQLLQEVVYDHFVRCYPSQLCDHIRMLLNQNIQINAIPFALPLEAEDWVVVHGHEKFDGADVNVRKDCHVQNLLHYYLLEVAEHVQVRLEQVDQAVLILLLFGLQ